jgi:hypothetical protein
MSSAISGHFRPSYKILKLKKYVISSIFAVTGLDVFFCNPGYFLRPKAAKYVEDFEIGEVDGDDLMNYSYSDLKNLGVVDDNDRRYLMKEIKKVNKKT